jgi:endonuclease YncB( thermonuclease family)
VRDRSWSLLLLIASAALGGAPAAVRAETPALYLPGLPGLSVPDMPKRPEEQPAIGPPIPDGTDRPGAKRGEVIVGTARAITGDTIRVQDKTFRLFGIVAPPMNEFGGYSSMQGLMALIGGRPVTCEPKTNYLRGQPVARCNVDRRDLSLDMVARGLARDCPRQSNGMFAPAERRAVVDVAGGFKLPDECQMPY